jgi:diaminohydroxyphosphoribosylaminopyrimidine deaminase/5-amino-6-(5-phosphoribosylamino)uracil reductase
MTAEDLYMHRCLDLAQTGGGRVAPNPMVGAVLVHDHKIIGEGFHAAFGEAHAEVHAIHAAIKNGYGPLLEKATLYVNLEPCSHTGKTPPCTDLILEKRIPAVVIGCADPNVFVNGRGIQKLKAGGVAVRTGVLEPACLKLNKRFITFHTHKRPYLLIKFAQSADRFMAPLSRAPLKFSGPLTDTLVHKWRSEESGIMAGAGTIAADDPQLTVRKWEGKNPVRITVDRNLRLPAGAKIFDGTAPAVVFNAIKDATAGTTEYVKIDFKSFVYRQVMDKLFERNLLSVMIEGGRVLINGLLEENLWDEARIIQSGIYLGEGIPAPDISGRLVSETTLTGDRITNIERIN